MLFFEGVVLEVLFSFIEVVFEVFFDVFEVF